VKRLVIETDGRQFRANLGRPLLFSLDAV